MAKKEIKVIFLGAGGVGKTSLIKRYINHIYDEYQNPTVGSSYVSKRIYYNNKDYNLNIWDVAGAEKYRSLAKFFIKESNIIVLVYDITSKKSFLDLQFYLDTILDNINYKISIILVGNKKDLYNNIEIKESVGNNFAKVIKAKFAEVSAKNNDNEWNEFFENALKDYIKQIEKTIEINYDYSDNEGYNIDDYLDIFEKI